MTFPSFSVGEVLTAADMNAVGLWLVKTQTVGTGVSSVIVTDCFSANYENYLFYYNNYTGNTNASLRLQFNNSTGTTYQLGGFFGSFGSAAFNGYGPAATDRFVDFGQIQTTATSTVAQIMSPFATGPTRIQSQSSSGGGYYHMYGRDSASASNTGFTLSHSAAGTITGGTIRVYGYRN